MMGGKTADGEARKQAKVRRKCFVAAKGSHTT